MRRDMILPVFLAMPICFAANSAGAVVNLNSDCTVKTTDAVIHVDNKTLKLPQGSAIKLKFMHFGKCLPVIITIPSGKTITACSGFLAGQAENQPKDVVTSISTQAIWVHSFSENPESKIDIKLDCAAAKLN